MKKTMIAFLFALSLAHSFSYADEINKEDKDFICNMLSQKSKQPLQRIHSIPSFEQYEKTIEDSQTSSTNSPEMEDINKSYQQHIQSLKFSNVKSTAINDEITRAQEVYNHFCSSISDTIVEEFLKKGTP